MVVNLTFRLILQTPQESDLAGKRLKQATYRVIKKLFIARLVFALLIVSIPVPAHAGVFSFVSGLFNRDSITVREQVILNSQNMVLLQPALNLDPNPAKGGGDITIIEEKALLSETGPTGSLADIVEQKNGDKISVYVVKEGDSLSGIAKMFGVSVNTVIWANDLHKSLIKEGQTLVILPVTGVRHAVVKGETIASITKKYKGNFNEIIQFNNLSEDSKLAVGDIVVIPDGEIGAYNYSNTGKNSSSSSYRGGSGPSYTGYYVVPVNGKRSQGLHGYNAIDIAASLGTSIVASASGKVIISKTYGWNGGYGGYIVIQHGNGTQTLYAHNSKNNVYVGQYVVQGQIIGYVGSTGKSTGPHVHFEVRGAKNPF